jgi:quinoprotein glucose dehydrogenase
MTWQRGLVFLPIGQPAGDYYGGSRQDQILHASSVVALDANTGTFAFSDAVSVHV